MADATNADVTARVHRGQGGAEDEARGQAEESGRPKTPVPAVNTHAYQERLEEPEIADDKEEATTGQDVMTNAESVLAKAQ